MIRRPSCGFSLVEVVLALGVIAFAIIAIIGLLSMTLRSGREANEDTLLPLMAGRIVDALRATKFQELTNSTNYPDGTRIYFDSQGLPSAEPSAQVYQCEIRWSAGPPSPGEDLSATLKRAVLTFTWPKGSTNQHFVLPVSLADCGEVP
jgi:uncharacterized protein (TIGR02598 family)